MTFWIPAAAIFAMLTLAFALALRRAGRAAEGSTARRDMEVYRAQMAEVARDAARGVLSPEEAEQSRIQIGRRLIEADRAQQAGTGAGEAERRAPRWATISAFAAVVVLLLGGTIGYLMLGATGYSDQPIGARYAAAEKLYDTRPAQAVAEQTAAKLRAEQKTQAPSPDPKFLALMDQLRASVKAHPDDPQGLELLARNELALGNYAAARDAARQILSLAGAMPGADDLAQMGEIDTVAAGGLVTGDAEGWFSKALDADPKNGKALYYLGLMMAQNGRPDRTFALWDRLLRDGAPDAPWEATVRQNMPALALAAGIQGYTPPEAPAAAQTAPGPTADDVAAAGQMSNADRAEMIRGMVGRLDERLHSEGGSTAEWARLVSSLRLIGDTEKAATVAAEAKTKLASDPAAAAAIDAALKAPAGGALGTAPNATAAETNQ